MTTEANAASNSAKENYHIRFLIHGREATPIDFFVWPLGVKWEPWTQKIAKQLVLLIGRIITIQPKKGLKAPLVEIVFDKIGPRNWKQKWRSKLGKYGGWVFEKFKNQKVVFVTYWLTCQWCN